MPPVADFDSIAGAWQKWEEILEPCFQRLNETLLEKAGIAENQQVLDLGCGSGTPALSIAKRIGKGMVIGVDVSEPMLAVARQKATAMNLSNVLFEHHDMDSLPFESDFFDAATARFSLMFVRSPQNTILEVLRVLKNGGRFSVCVWGEPEKNPLPRNVLRHYCDIPSNDPELPGPYRFADKGRLANLLQQSGFTGTGEEEMEIDETFQSGEEYVQHLIEASALWGSLLRKMAPEQLQTVSNHLVREAEKYRKGTQIFTPRFARVVYGTKS